MTSNDWRHAGSGGYTPNDFYEYRNADGRRPAAALISICLLFSCAHPQPIRAPSAQALIPAPSEEKLVGNPAAEFLLFNDPSDAPGQKVCRIRHDFNGDGEEDQAITASTYMAEATPWWFFVQVSSDLYHWEPKLATIVPTPGLGIECCLLDDMQADNCAWKDYLE